MVMHRKGQVFLMAAIIIAGLIFALTKVSNQGFARAEPEAFYDLADEIGFETKKVLDYGIINGQTPQAISSFADSLLVKHAEYIAHEDVVFIYGNALTGVSARYYQSVTALSAITLNNVFIPITLITNTPVEVSTTTSAGVQIATVRIRGNDYVFNLKPGQNFYFVLIKEDEGEQFVSLK